MIRLASGDRGVQVRILVTDGPVYLVSVLGEVKDPTQGVTV